MDANVLNNPRSSNIAHYGIYIGVVAIVVQTVVQMTGSTEENKRRIGIGLAALVMNFVASLRVFSHRPHLPISIPELGSQTGNMLQNDWKTIIFKVIFIFTAILTPYLAFSALLPDLFTWYGFVIICTIVSIVKGHEKLRTMFTWSNGVFVSAVTYVIKKLKELISKPQIEPTL